MRLGTALRYGGRMWFDEDHERLWYRMARDWTGYGTHRLEEQLCV